MMGFSADGLGNHNFDKGFQYLFDTLAPLARVPVPVGQRCHRGRQPAGAASPTTPVAAAVGHLPDSPLDDVRLQRGALGLIGFTNPDAPALFSAGRPRPVPGRRSGRRDQRRGGAAARRRSRRGRRLRSHGRDRRHLTNPTGPVITPPTRRDRRRCRHRRPHRRPGADDPAERRAGGREPQQGRLLHPRPPCRRHHDRQGRLQDRRLPPAVDDRRHHGSIPRSRPGSTNCTPNSQPVLGTLIGQASVPIPRADSCGTEIGRTCESLIGNVVTDAIRTTYDADFAVTNSGGIRADLTCPPEGRRLLPGRSRR